MSETMFSFMVIIQKLHNTKPLKIKILQLSDTHTYVSGDCGMLMFKGFALCDIWINPKHIRTQHMLTTGVSTKRKA